MVITLSIKYYHRKTNPMKMEHDVEIYINCSYSILKIKVTTLKKFINNSYYMTCYLDINILCLHIINHCQIRLHICNVFAL